MGKTTRTAQPPARRESERGYAPLLAISTTVHVSHLHIHAYGRHVDAIAIWGKPSIPNIIPNSPSIQSFWSTAPEVRLVDFSLPYTLPFPFREMGKSLQTFSGLEPTTSEKHLPETLPGKLTSPSGKHPGLRAFAAPENSEENT